VLLGAGGEPAGAGATAGGASEEAADATLTSSASSASQAPASMAGSVKGSSWMDQKARHSVLFGPSIAAEDVVGKDTALLLWLVMLVRWAVRRRGAAGRRPYPPPQGHTYPLCTADAVQARSGAIGRSQRVAASAVRVRCRRSGSGWGCRGGGRSRCRRSRRWRRRRATGIAGGTGWWRPRWSPGPPGQAHQAVARRGLTIGDQVLADDG
jgi:hypothetical protein